MIDRTLWYDSLVDETSPGSGTPIDKAFIDGLLDSIDAVLDAIDDKGAIAYAAATELTIASDAVTLTAGNNVFSVDTESNAASDNLATITLDASGRACRLLILKPENVARVVTLKHGTGNLQLKGGDFAMNDANHRITLYRDGSTWYELSRNAGGGTVAGSDTQVQFNDGGAFGGDAGMTYNKTTDTLTIAALALSGQPTNWTPSDGSGASLSFTVNSQAKAMKIGKLVVAWFDITYPSTANGSNAVIGGLPYTSDSVAYGALVFARMSESTLKQGQISPGGTTATLYDQTGNNITNATMSTDLVKAMAVYLAAS